MTNVTFVMIFAGGDTELDDNLKSSNSTSGRIETTMLNKHVATPKLYIIGGGIYTEPPPLWCPFKGSLHWH